MMDKLVNSLLFKPPQDPVPYSFPSGIIWLETRQQERIAATHIRRKGAILTLLFSHGNAEDLTTSYSSMRRLSRDLNVNVVGYDYTGYGECTGTPSETNCYADIEAVYRYLREDEAIKPEQIVLYGRSLGSGPSCHLAAKTAREGRSVAALILHSPFTSVYRVVFDFGFTMVGDKFRNIDLVHTLQCPVFVVHGREDKVVPFEHGQAIYNALPTESKAIPFFVDGMGHNNPGYHLDLAITERLNQFLEFHVLLRKGWLLPPSASKARSGCKRENARTSSDEGMRATTSVRASM